MKSRDISKISTLELVLDYKSIQKIEDEYFRLCKKYDPDSVYESDPVLVDILLELGKRQLRDYK